jgi:hypothetical protein
MKFAWDFMWPLIVVFGVYAVYSIIIKPQMTETAQVLGKDAQLAQSSGLVWFWTLIDGWKTHILAVIAIIPQVLQLMDPGLIAEWQQLPWGTLFDPKVANAVTALCAFLIPITHTMGLLKAAKTPPQV